MNVKSTSLFIVLSLISRISLAQDILELDLVEIESSSPSEKVQLSSSSSLLSSALSQVDQNRSTISYQNYTSSDIMIEYNGILLNDVTDSKVNLRFYPKVLFEQIGIGELSGSYAPSLSLRDDYSNLRLVSLATKSTLGYSALLKNDLGGMNYIFFDYDLGKFKFRDEQGSLHTREHNSFNRYGLILNQYQTISTSVLEEHLILSHYYRDEPGLSEFPGYYEKAYEDAYLVAGDIRWSFYLDEHTFYLDSSHKAQHMKYENVTSRTASQDYMDYWDYSGIYKLGYEFNSLKFELSHEMQYQSSYEIYRNLLNAKLSYDCVVSDFNIKTTVSLLTDYDSVLFPSGVRLSYLGLEGWDFYITYDHRSRFPTFNELYFRTEFVRGDSGLKPQNLDSVGVGAQFVRGVVHSSIELDYSNNRNMIRFISVTPELFKVYNLDDYSVLELKTGVGVGTDFIDFGADYTYTYAPYKDGTTPLVSSHILNAYISCSYLDLYTKLSYSYKSPYYINFMNTVQSLTDHYLELSIDYSYESWRFGLDFSNLLFQRRETSLQKPLPRFQVQLGLQYSY